MAADQRKPGKPPTESFIARIDARIDERARRYTDEQIAATAAAAQKESIAQLASRIDREVRADIVGISELRVKAAGTTIVLAGTAASEVVRKRVEAHASSVAPNATIENFILVKR
ncbi:MAG TPA: hypothetical protein VL326_14360 [Kofleriaceae bacterium]|jgi:hypothetical protein|nr:hypothetical protein [Kofleriaceae bacterium]